jgi:glycosyltransferase involved in cell wall biosynthesis
MRVLIIDYPWEKTWLPLYAKAINDLGHEVGVWDGNSNARVKSPDVVLCTWADRDYTDLFPGARNVLMMRRFEFFHAGWLAYKWDKIAGLICCNPWIAAQVKKAIPDHVSKVHYINNPIDPSRWTFKKRAYSNKVGMVCRIHSVKNLSLAAQIIMASGGLILHIAGETNDSWIEVYLRHLLGDSLVLHGRVPNEKLDDWWNWMEFCLSTSISEGDPMCVLEACAKGIKPIIHNWPGASDMYPREWLFDTVDEAIKMMVNPDYKREEYRNFVVEKRPMSLADDVAKIVCDGILGDSEPSNLSSIAGGRVSPSFPRSPEYTNEVRV